MKDQFVKKNVKLSLELDTYLAKHPALYKKIPNGAYVVITQKGDPEFSKASLDIIKSPRKKTLVEAQKSGSHWTLRPLAAGN